MNESHVLAVDPGGTTGWAMSAQAGLAEPMLVVHGEADFLTFLDVLDSLFARSADEGRPTEIVAERYVITPRTAKLSQQTTALEVIGVLKYFANRYDVLMTLQTPADAKRFATNDRLAAREWLQRPLAANDHANDAIRHLMTHLVKTKRMRAVVPPPSHTLDP